MNVPRRIAGRPGAFFDVSPIIYFAYTGWIIGVLLAVTSEVRWRLGELGWMLTQQMLAVAVITAAFAALALVLGQTTWLGALIAWRERHLRWASRIVARSPLWMGAATYVVTAIVLLWYDNRRFVIVIALFQTAAICILCSERNAGRRIGFAAVSIASWGLASGFSFTHLSDWLLNASPAGAFAVPAFVLSFALVLCELNGDPQLESGRPSRRRVVFWLALIVFSAYALRVDNLLTEWVPIHRSYYADIAQSVRDGHWLLWDVPSLYGFLSILTLAVIPAPNAWQALYELTAVLLVSQSCITFAILRWGRSGWVNATFATLFPLAALGDNLSRYPWSSRLYPQGGLRFFWIVDLLFVAFLMYVWRDDKVRVRALRMLGHCLWLCAILWSIENGLWATVIWLPFVVIDALTASPAAMSKWALAGRVVRHLAPLVALPLLAFAGIETVYRVELRTAPDWRAYAEFTGLFTSGKIRAIFHVQDLGAGWSIVLVLGAVGALGITALLARRWNVLPLLTATWLAVWATSSYYAVEPLDLYVALLLGVLVPAAAIACYVSREVLPNYLGAVFARLSIAPLAIIAIAFLFGEPSNMAKMTWPFAGAWSFDSTRSFPPVSGELARILSVEGIRPGDRVVFENGDYWTELDQGLVFPFARGPGGAMVEYKAWLPVSPMGPQQLTNALSAARRKTYIERYLARTRSGGWYVTYRHPADCRALSPHLLTRLRRSSTNFSAASCTFVSE